MQTQVRKDREAFICAVIGDIDMYSAPTLHGTWREHAANRAPAPFIVDMARTEYLDSSGVGVFVQILADSRARGIPFFICNVRGMAEKLMRLSHMSFILPIEATLEDALGKACQRASAQTR